VHDFKPPPFIVPEMNVTIVAPYMVVGIVYPLEYVHGLPSEHEHHTNHPLHRTTFVHFALAMLMLLKVICFFLI
jgi:hypothetical protein